MLALTPLAMQSHMLSAQPALLLQREACGGQGW